MTLIVDPSLAKVEKEANKTTTGGCFEETETLDQDNQAESSSGGTTTRHRNNRRRRNNRNEQRWWI